MQNPLLKAKIEEIRKMSDKEILQHLNLILFIPKKAAQILEIFTERKVKHTKLLKTAIFLQKHGSWKQKKTAMEYILSVYDMFDISCVLSEGNSIQAENNIDDKFIDYDFENVKKALAAEMIDNNLLNFCKNLKIVFEKRMRTKNKKFLADVLELTRLFGTKKRLSLSYYVNLKIYDEKVLIVLLNERRFRQILKFMMCINGDMHSKSKLLKMFIRVNEKWKEWQKVGYPKLNDMPEDVTSVLNKKIDVEKMVNVLSFDIDEEEECTCDECMKWVIE